MKYKYIIATIAILGLGAFIALETAPTYEEEYDKYHEAWSRCMAYESDVIKEECKKSLFGWRSVYTEEEFHYYAPEKASMLVFSHYVIVFSVTGFIWTVGIIALYNINFNVKLVKSDKYDRY
jgi:hypothetical protein